VVRGQNSESSCTIYSDVMNERSDYTTISNEKSTIITEKEFFGCTGSGTSFARATA